MEGEDNREGDYEQNQSAHVDYVFPRRHHTLASQKIKIKIPNSSGCYNQSVDPFCRK